MEHSNVFLTGALFGFVMSALVYWFTLRDKKD